MPTPAKTMNNSTKHWTKAERERREAAEAVTMLARGRPRTARKIITGDPAAQKYWVRIWEQMEVHEILDYVDEYALASYCSLLAMRDRLAALTPKLLNQLEHMEDMAEDDEALRNLAVCFKACDGLSAARLKVESQLLQLADKLGLTPSGRSRLAVHRQAAEAADKDDDLFG